MKKTAFIVLAIACLPLLGCGDKETREREKETKPTFMFWNFRKEIVSADYHVPDMKTDAAVKYLQSRLKTLPGYEGSTADLEKQIMTVSYQSSTARKMNIEEAIALAGFAVNYRPANPKAKIPEGVK